MAVGFAVYGSGCYVAAGKQSVGSGFLNQPFYGCPEKEGKQGLGFADYTLSPWSPVAGLFSCDLFPVAPDSNSFLFFFSLSFFFFFKLLVFASEKKGLFVCFGDRWFKRWGKDPEKRVHRKTNRSCGLDRGF